MDGTFSRPPAGTADFLVSAIDNFGDTGFALDFAERLLEKRPDWRVRFFSDDRKLFDLLSAGRIPERLEYRELSDYGRLAPADRIASFFDRKIPEARLAEFAYPKKILAVSYLRFDADVPGKPGVGSFDGTRYRIGHDEIAHLVPSPLEEGSGVIVGGRTGGISGSDGTEYRGLPSLADGFGILRIGAFCYAPARERLPDIEKAGGGRLRIWEFSNPEAVRPLPFLRFDAYAEALRSFDANIVRGENSAVKAMLAGKPFLWDFYKESNGAHREKIDDFLAFARPFFTEAEDFRRYSEATLAFNGPAFGDREARRCADVLSDRSEAWSEAFRRMAETVRGRNFSETALREWENVR